ncbi:MAG: hypothetical protein KC619_30850 [Myxococcales bacterium]|nr:hypothetical protein [Myxococcales bacterium]
MRSVIASLLLAACGAGSPVAHPREPPPARMTVALSEGRVDGELVGVSLRSTRLFPPLVVRNAWRDDAAVPYLVRADQGLVYFDFEDIATRIRFGAEDLADPRSPYLHVSEERVELTGGAWFPVPDAPIFLEVRAELPRSMRILCTGEPDGDGRWRIPRGTPIAVIGIADARELRAGRVALVYDDGWLDEVVAQDLATLASRARATFDEAFGPTERGRLTIAMPPREGAGYWTHGLLVVPQYYAGYGQTTAAMPEPPSDAPSLAIDVAGLTPESAAGSSALTAPDEPPLEEVESWRRHAIVHEVAHEHWHDFPEVDGWLRLDEALAEYAVLLVLEGADRERALTHHVASLLTAVLLPDPVQGAWDPEAYDRGPLFLLALERATGRERLHGFLRSLRRRRARGPVSEEAFLTTLEAELGPEALALFAEWSPSAQPAR